MSPQIISKNLQKESKRQEENIQSLDQWTVSQLDKELSIGIVNRIVSDGRLWVSEKESLWSYRF